MATLGIGIVGLGNATRTLHVPALASLGAMARVVGAYDRDERQRARAASECGFQVFDSAEAMLDEARPDVVLVATHPESHASYCLQALEYGAHVICEKPFTYTLSEADAVIAAATAAGRRIALNHEFREMPIFRALLDTVAADEVVFAQAWQLMNLPPWKEPNWRAEMPERTLYEAGIHLVDFLMAVFGERPVSVVATTSSCGAREEASDAVALVTLEFSNGRLASVVQDRLCPGDTQFFEVRVDTRSESLRASFGGRARVTAGMVRATRPHFRMELGKAGIAWRERGMRRTLLARNPADPAMHATRRVLERSLAAFIDDREPPVSGADGRDAIAVIAACYESAATGGRVTV